MQTHYQAPNQATPVRRYVMAERNNTRTYRSWASMLNRCRNENYHRYDRYGGRGIKVCKRWLCFNNFLSDMGERPKGTTLERLDNDGDYNPQNCEWSTRKAQANNRRSNRLITAFGVTRTLMQWSDFTGLSRSAIGHRIRRGWPINDALSKPPQYRPKAAKKRGEQK